MTLALNSRERVEIEMMFMRVFELDEATVSLNTIINTEQDENMKKVLGIAQARLARERDESWIELCRITRKYTEPPYVEPLLQEKDDELRRTTRIE